MFDELGEPLSEEEAKKVIDDVAEQVVKRGMEVPSIMFLEMNKPITYVASQGLIVLMPFLAPLFGPDRVGRYSRFLQTRENIEKLIERIEEMSEERRLEKKKAKAEKDAKE